MAGAEERGINEGDGSPASAPLTIGGMDSAAATPALDTYLGQLPLPAEARATLKQESAGGLGRLQQALSQGPDPAIQPAAPANPAYRSILGRLRLAFAPPPRPGDEKAGEICTTDVRGEIRLVTTPPLIRASMVPLPWETNPLRRWGRRLRRRMVGGHPTLAPANNDDRLKPD